MTTTFVTLTTLIHEPIEVNMALVRRMKVINDNYGWNRLEFDQNDHIDVRETKEQIEDLILRSGKPRDLL